MRAWGGCLVDAEVIGDGVHIQEPKHEQRDGDDPDERERNQDQARELVPREALSATRQAPGLGVPRERFGGHPAGYYATFGTSARASTERA